MNADDVAELLGMERLELEGGMLAQTWRDERSSTIYYLMRPGDFSALHRLPGPELWHHYAGAAVQMLLLEPGGAVSRPGLADDWPEGVGRWHAAAPLGRLGTSEDVGDACVFLCSDLARWITGADLVVDGGVLTRQTW